MSFSCRLQDSLGVYAFWVLFSNKYANQLAEIQNVTEINNHKLEVENNEVESLRMI